jgi:lipopolysaccharide export system protein LptA
MAGKTRQINWRHAAWLVVLAGLVSAVVVSAQTQAPKAGSSTRVQRIFYDAPHQLQPKMDIHWTDEAALPTGGKVLIKGLTADTYQDTGQRGLTMEAPECVFGFSENSGTSPGPLKVRTADGNSFIEGTGYLWSYKGSNLVVTISNNVSTTLKRDFLNSGTNRTAAASVSATNQFVYIHADQVFMDRAANLIVYTGNVRAEDERIELTCEILTIRGATNNEAVAGANTVASGKISEIIADHHVVIVDKAAVAGQATGERAVYAVVDGAEVMTLTGDPHWAAGLRDATARAFIYNLSTNTLRAAGDANFRLPSDSLNQSGFVMLQPSAGGAKTTGTGTNLTYFSAEDITLQLPATNGGPLLGVIAETNVVILDPASASRAVGNRAVYTQTNGMMELIGNASWQSDRRVARGELLTFNQNDNSFSAHTNASLEFPPGELNQSSALGGLSATNAGRATNQLVRVLADSYDYQNDTLTFHDHVRGAVLEDETVRDTLESGSLEIGFINTNTVRYAIADGGVHLHRLPVQDAAGRTEEGDFTSRRLEARMRTNAVPAQTNLLLEQVIATGGVAAWQTKTFTTSAPLLLSRTNHTTFSGDRLTASFMPDTNRVDVATSEGNVIMTRDDYTARGGKVVYRATNDTVVLTGNPRLETTNGSLTSDDMITYDHAQGIIQATRHMHMVFDVPAGAEDKINQSAAPRQNPK